MLNSLWTSPSFFASNTNSISPKTERQEDPLLSFKEANKLEMKIR